MSSCAHSAQSLNLAGEKKPAEPEEMQFPQMKTRIPKLNAPPGFSQEYVVNRFLALRQKRRETIQRINSLIRLHYGDKYKVVPFGSTCYGAGSRDSDIDLVILVGVFVMSIIFKIHISIIGRI